MQRFITTFVVDYQDKGLSINLLPVLAMGQKQNATVAKSSKLVVSENIDTCAKTNNAK